MKERELTFTKWSELFEVLFFLISDEQLLLKDDQVDADFDKYLADNYTSNKGCKRNNSKHQ